MKTQVFGGRFRLLAFWLVALICLAGRLDAKRKPDTNDPNDATNRLFARLDGEFGGKLDDLCILADSYKDPAKPDEEYRHVLRIDYDKNRAFGKLRLYVRSVGSMNPEQLRAYTTRQIFDFGETDLEKYVKTAGGPFGGEGDLYLHAKEDTPLASAPITEDVRKRYDDFVSQYVMPALDKK